MKAGQSLKDSQMTSIAPCLWCNGTAEEAATFYVALLPDSRIDRVNRTPVATPGNAADDVITVDFTLVGRPFMMLNGGPQFPYTEAVSMSVTVETQPEIDRLWDALIADGGKPVQCGWLKDRWGLSWQIVPAAMERMMTSPDRAAAGRAMQAMMGMIKLDLATLERAFAGESE